MPSNLSTLPGPAVYPQHDPESSHLTSLVRASKIREGSQPCRGEARLQCLSLQSSNLLDMRFWEQGCGVEFEFGGFVVQGAES
jgi:hypothetical protein